MMNILSYEVSTRRGEGHIPLKDLAFGTGGVVLGKLHDSLEQLAAAIVVEPFRRQRLRLCGQTRENIPA